MDDKIKQAYLYDFYGELLNEHQRRIYEEFYFNDLSLGEIALEDGISRQGVSDMLKRCTRKLESYEQKLHLVEKFLRVRDRVERLNHLTKEFRETQDSTIIAKVEEISNQILEEL